MDFYIYYLPRYNGLRISYVGGRGSKRSCDLQSHIAVKIIEYSAVCGSFTEIPPKAMLFLAKFLYIFPLFLKGSWPELLFHSGYKLCSLLHPPRPSSPRNSNRAKFGDVIMGLSEGMSD